LYLGDWVSIHAPARGATESSNTSARRPSVSIHAPARGATCIGFTVPGTLYGFNPRAREGRDTMEKWFDDGYSVSIHAPARGATI